MQVANWYNLNGKYFTESENHVSINNRSFRYGDGFFETMKIIDGEILLKQLHFERIKRSFEVLKFQMPQLFSFEKLEQDILQTVKKNKQFSLARVRINFFRKDGELFEANNHQCNILIQSFKLNEAFNELNKNGLMIDIFPDAKKSTDIFSNIKTNNYLPYTMAAIWAKEQKLNDALLLNFNNHIVDSCIANIFLISGENIITPSLESGCVDGVMRKYIIQQLQHKNSIVIEKQISIEDVLQADEVFLTNAIKGISWVKQCSNATYPNLKIQHIYKQIFS
jgi:aminodeoxychorismate lyase